MIVVDASVTTYALLYTDGRGRRARAALARDSEWTVPEHWTIEVFAAVRGLVAGRKVSQEQARTALGRLTRLAVERVPADELIPRMWELRSDVSAYDAPYLALAESRGLTLVTADGRLARTATRFCRVELVV